MQNNIPIGGRVARYIIFQSLLETIFSRPCFLFLLKINNQPSGSEACCPICAYFMSWCRWSVFNASHKKYPLLGLFLYKCPYESKWYWRRAHHPHRGLTLNVQNCKNTKTLIVTAITVIFVSNFRDTFRRSRRDRR